MRSANLSPNRIRATLRHDAAPGRRAPPLGCRRHTLQLLLGGGGGGELLKDGDALPQPLLQVGLHGRATHALQPLELRLGAGEVGVLVLSDEAELLLAAAGAVGRLAERGAARLLDVGLHVLVLAELVAHGALGLLGVRRALVPRLGVEVPDRRPAAGARVVGAADGLLREIDIAECHICVVLKRRRDCIPRGRLLPSSASSLGRNPADEERLAGVDGGLDEVVEAGLGALVHLVEVALGVDAREERDRRDAEHRGSGSSDATRSLGTGGLFRTSACRESPCPRRPFAVRASSRSTVLPRMVAHGKRDMSAAGGGRFRGQTRSVSCSKWPCTRLSVEGCARIASTTASSRALCPPAVAATASCAYVRHIRWRYRGRIVSDVRVVGARAGSNPFDAATHRMCGVR
eukprot:scaffold50947_cov80-Phaeocystis_antarctica.AAC.1